MLILIVAVVIDLGGLSGGGESADDIAWGSSGRDARWLTKFRRLLSRTEESDRRLLMFMAQKTCRAEGRLMREW